METDRKLPLILECVHDTSNLDAGKEHSWLLTVSSLFTDATGIVALLAPLEEHTQQ